MAPLLGDRVLFRKRTPNRVDRVLLFPRGIGPLARDPSPRVAEVLADGCALRAHELLEGLQALDNIVELRRDLPQHAEKVRLGVDWHAPSVTRIRHRYVSCLGS